MQVGVQRMHKCQALTNSTMYYLKSFICIVLMIPTLLACNNKKDEFDEQLTSIQSVKVLTGDIKSGETMSIGLVFPANNSCGEFNRFEETWIDDYTLEVKAYVRYPKDVHCAQAIKSIEKTYTFKPEKPGFYMLKFYANNTYLTEQIVVK